MPIIGMDDPSSRRVVEIKQCSEPVSVYLSNATTVLCKDKVFGVLLKEGLLLLQNAGPPVPLNKEGKLTPLLDLLPRVFVCGLCFHTHRRCSLGMKTARLALSIGHHCLLLLPCNPFALPPGGSDPGILIDLELDILLALIHWRMGEE